MLEQRQVISQYRSFILKNAIVQEVCSNSNANAIALQYHTGPACCRSHNITRVRPCGPKADFEAASTRLSSRRSLVPVPTACPSCASAPLRSRSCASSFAAPRFCLHTASRNMVVVHPYIASIVPQDVARRSTRLSGQSRCDLLLRCIVVVRVGRRMVMSCEVAVWMIQSLRRGARRIHV
jgi:hypothetical protein